jgi:predicted nucleic acid-binding protein
VRQRSIYAEYEEVLRRPRLKRGDDIVVATLAAIRDKGLWVRPTTGVRACLDPDNDMFLDCAQAARADYLVTGNLKHFPTSWAGTRVVAARWLLEHLSLAQSEEGR